MSDPIIIQFYYDKPLDAQFIESALNRLMDCGASYYTMEKETLKPNKTIGKFELALDYKEKNGDTKTIAEELEKNVGFVHLCSKKKNWMQVWFYAKKKPLSTIHIAIAQAEVSGENSWDWVKEVLQSMSKTNPLYGFAETEARMQSTPDEIAEQLLKRIQPNELRLNLQRTKNGTYTITQGY